MLASEADMLSDSARAARARGDPVPSVHGAAPAGTATGASISPSGSREWYTQDRRKPSVTGRGAAASRDSTSMYVSQGPST